MEVEGKEEDFKHQLYGWLKIRVLGEHGPDGFPYEYSSRWQDGLNIPSFS